MQAAKGSDPEATVILGGWIITTGTYGDGTEFSLRKPSYQFKGATPKFFSVRIASPLVGQGLLEAMEEATIAELADTQAREKKDGVAGRMQLVIDPETGQVRLGRFGWKAGQARLKHQIANALNNDMGITTTVYPKADRGAAQADRGTSGQLSDADLDHMYRYLATLGLPPRRNFDDPQVAAGEALFASAGCARCHVPTLKTSSYHPLAELRRQTIHPYTDLLLHDMGADLADNMAEGKAGAADWRTPPLWGIGLTAAVSGEGEAYLHDGRARSLTEAILWHGGEAQRAREAFRTMPAADRAALIQFLKSL
jgi:CxxC motif-containing protein (DUF1111 family)